MNIATAARDSARVVKWCIDRSSNSSVECHDSITLLSRADPTRPIDCRIPVRIQAARKVWAVYSALIGVQYDTGHRLTAPADGDSHRQRPVSGLGVVVLTHG